MGCGGVAGGAVVLWSLCSPLCSPLCSAPLSGGGMVVVPAGVAGTFEEGCF